MKRRFCDVVEYVHVGPQIKVLKDHCQLGPKTLQLLVVFGLQHTVFCGLQ